MPSEEKDNFLSYSVKIAQTGFAMFSMFFGSGNTIFPVMVGAASGDKVLFGTFGFLLSGVLVPFVGLLSMFLFHGDYFAFFGRLGKVTSWVIIIAIMALIGPFAIIPRCILVSYGAVHSFAPFVNLNIFSFLSCVLIFFCTYKRRRVIEILGLYLTPILLLSLGIIIVKGLISNCVEPESSMTGSQSFQFGLLEGYNTMDIFAGFMFSSLLLNSIRSSFPKKANSQKDILLLSVKSGFVGIFCLALVYLGMSYVASFHASCLEGVSHDKILSRLTFVVLGQSAGIIVCLAVSFACLTTAISLSLVFSEFVSGKLCCGKVSYKLMLFLTLSLSYFCSLLKFEGVQALVIPVLTVCYPSLILLAVLNLLYKTVGFKMVKLPCLVVFLVSLVSYFYQ